MRTNLYSVTLIAGTGDGTGIHDYELRNSERPDTVICHMRLPLGSGGFWNGLLNAQAEKAWEEGAEAMSGQDNGGPMAENPFTVEEPAPWAESLREDDHTDNRETTK